jgi:hypothetical protein
METNTRETVRTMTDGQRNDLIATVIATIPSLTFDEAQGIIGAKGPLVADFRTAWERAKARFTEPTSYPATDEIFELTLDGDAAENQPLEMVRRDGYNPKGWQHRGPVVKGRHTKRFKLVEIGYCRNFDEVRRKLAIHGEIPEGQWREAFRARYGKPDGKGPIGIADALWVIPYSSAYFPYVGLDGDSNFRWTDSDFYDVWRWLVVCK